MIAAIALFELRYQLRRPLWWVIAGLFFLLTFAITASDVIRISMTGSSYRNAPGAIIDLFALLSVFCLFLTSVFVARAILRDFEHRTAELFYSRPVSRLRFLLGRFLGGYLVSATVFMGAVAGHLLGSRMPWIDPEQFGPFMLSSYLWAVFVIALPNLFFCAAVTFSLASMQRSLAATFVGLVAVIVAFQLAGMLITHLGSEHLAVYLDPFALGALDQATRYWTVAEHNTALPELRGVILHNRLIWLGVSLAILAFPGIRFRYTTAGGGTRRKQESSSAARTPALPAAIPLAPAPEGRSFTFATACRQFWHQTRIDTRAVVGSVPFLVIMALGLLNLIYQAAYQGRLGDTPVDPVTHLMLEPIKQVYNTLLLIIVIFLTAHA